MGRLIPFTFTHKKWWHIYNFCRCSWCNYLLCSDGDIVNAHPFLPGISFNNSILISLRINAAFSQLSGSACILE